MERWNANEVSSAIAQVPPQELQRFLLRRRRGKQGVLAELPGLRAQKDLEGQWPKSQRDSEQRGESRPARSAMSISSILINKDTWENYQRTEARP